MKIDDQNETVSKLLGDTKYFQEGEEHREATARIAGALADDDTHFRTFRGILGGKRFLPAGRVMVAAGAVRRTTPYNCFVSGTIEDSMDSITKRLTEALQTMRLGGGIGYDFSRLRPSGFRIRSLDSTSCGPVGNERNHSGFMDLFDAGCSTIRSAGHRRGAQMGVIRVDHPDVLHFIRAKREQGRLRNFNLSVAITDKFMEAVEKNDTFDLVFEGERVETIDANALWNDIMRHTWDYSEPGVLFIDSINQMNNLSYCETIETTNPCGEQPLPPFGACLLGSFNLTQYIKEEYIGIANVKYEFDWGKFAADVAPVVRAMDNVVDRAIYPLPEQEREAKSKRRMGLGVTGLANTAEILRFPYGSDLMKRFTEEILIILRNEAYKSSIELAKEKGPFKLFDKDKYCDSNFITTLPDEIQDSIYDHGIRNSHLLSIAPTGTISLFAGNVSSGIEPVFKNGLHGRNITLPDGTIHNFRMIDWAEKHYGVIGKESGECSIYDHIDILNTASNLVDSSVSKTSNVGKEISFEEFKGIYKAAYYGGSKGCTTFRPSAIRGSVLTEEVELGSIDGAACFVDEAGNRSCE